MRRRARRGRSEGLRFDTCDACGRHGLRFVPIRLDGTPGMCEPLSLVRRTLKLLENLFIEGKIYNQAFDL